MMGMKGRESMRKKRYILKRSWTIILFYLELIILTLMCLIFIGLTFYFENSTKSYVYRSHGLPDMDQNEEKIFANVFPPKDLISFAIKFVYFW